MNFLENLKSDFNAVNIIEEKLFDVRKIQLHTGMEGFNSPNSFGMYKGTGGDSMGTVGKDFTPQQPKMLFASLVECVRSNDQIDLSAMKYHEMKGGAKVRFEMPIGRVSFKNIRGQEDESLVSLNLQTGFDGLTKTSLYLSTFRLVCTNGMKASITEFTTSFKNTQGNVGKAVTLCNDLSKGVAQMPKLDEMYKYLNTVSVNQAQVDEFLTKVTGYNVKDYNELNLRSRNILDKINESVALEFGRTGASAFGLLNGITHYTNHVAKGSENSDFAFIGGGMGMNDKALKFALELN